MLAREWHICCIKQIRDYSWQKYNTSIKKEIATIATSHLLTPSASAAAPPRACLSLETTIFIGFATRRGAAPRAPTPPSALPLMKHRVSTWPFRLSGTVNSGKESFCCQFLSPAWYSSFFLNTHSCVNSNMFLYVSPTHQYRPLFFLCSFFSSSVLTPPLTSSLLLPANFVRSADVKRQE